MSRIAPHMVPPCDQIHTFDAVSNAIAPHNGIICDDDMFLQTIYSSPLGNLSFGSCESGSTSDDAAQAKSVSPGANARIRVVPGAASGTGAGTGATPKPGALPSTISAEKLDELLQEKNMKEERLARKAQLARLNRRRKKAAMDELQAEVNQLREELARVRKRQRVESVQPLSASSPATEGNTENVAVPSVSPVNADEKQRVQQRMTEVAKQARRIKDAEDEESPPAWLPQARASLCDDVKDVVARLRALEQGKLELVKGLDTVFESGSMELQFIRWMLSRDDEQFYDDRTGMWQALFRDHIGLNDEQMEALSAIRPTMRAQRDQDARVRKAMQQLVAALQPSLELANTSMNRLTSVLEPHQLARYFAWVRDNQLCVRMLQNVP